ncbi:MAG: type II toxin-antitoxin system HicB family antitoxin [Candidatus Methanolliviera hydrocarbonicum]|uniref:Type II toxin-antitoxin system HicB family antitoxin n=1 Tax=Candidatus Methanolliviera hydrocarbonicum TaxID=2491085 RepID=A0A520KWQ6_9EURY|nr:MAG: type II toxin-antitoxin system HicB family antitoxin [Candidatus Methanolliviera hydrocarbonicum]
MRMTVVLEEEEERGYTVYVPSLPGCISQGETREEALKNIKEVLKNRRFLACQASLERYRVVSGAG